MRQALAKNPRRIATAMVGQVPSPTKGWNARDPLDTMDPKDAIRLDNLFPQTGYVELRRGHTVFATSLGTGAVETLMEYQSGANRKFIAAANANLYDITSGGAGTSLDSGLSNNRWQWTNHSNGVTGYLIMVNGADTARKYDGSTVSTTAFTGPSDPTLLIDVISYRSRLYFIEKDTASIWYASNLAIAGALTKFDLQGLHPQGGPVIAMSTLTHDGGNGPDDYMLFFMQSGAVIIYSGINPGDSSWALVGIFSLGPVVSRRGIMKLGGDTICITNDGYIPVGQLLKAGRTQTNLALSDRIGNAVSDVIRNYKSNYGWQAIQYPKGNMALFNVPLSSTTYQQHVVNTITGAWCRFTGLNGVSWGAYNEDLYFGGTDGRVYKADTGTNDNGSNISADGITSYQYIGGRARVKKFNLYAPIIATEQDTTVMLGLGVDFDTNINTVTVSSATTSASVWDDGVWDDAVWAGSLKVRKDWQGSGQIGRCASMRLQVQTKNNNLRWFSTNFQYETGGML